MVPNINMLEKLAHEHRQALLREADHQRRQTKAQPAHTPHWLHSLAARLGGYLVAFGTRLQRAQAVE